MWKITWNLYIFAVKEKRQRTEHDLREKRNMQNAAPTKRTEESKRKDAKKRMIVFTSNSFQKLHNLERVQVEGMTYKGY